MIPCAETGGRSPWRDIGSVHRRVHEDAESTRLPRVGPTYDALAIDNSCATGILVRCKPIRVFSLCVVLPFHTRIIPACHTCVGKQVGTSRGEPSFADDVKLRARVETQ
jgi:hypothetical protein